MSRGDYIAFLGQDQTGGDVEVWILKGRSDGSNLVQ